MRKVALFFTIVLMLFCFTGVALAEDIMLEKQIKNITFKADKNGNPYVRVIVAGTATVKGVTYNKDMFITGFDADVVAACKALKKGQTFKAIVAKGTYKGSPSYTILKVI